MVAEILNFYYFGYMAKITKRSVDALASNGSRPKYLWDDALTGFGIKALPSGSKRYLVKYRTSGGGRAAPQHWLTLGAHGQITADQARDLAQQALAAVARGEDPQGAKFKQRTAPTLRDVWARFEEEHLPLKKGPTRIEYLSQWVTLIEPLLGKKTVEAISRGEIDRFHKSMNGTPYRANRTLALLSRLMSLAEAWEWRNQGTNPCAYVERFAERARARFLNADELGRFGNAIEVLTNNRAISDTAGNAVMLLLLTGARLNEVLRAEWAWVDEKAGILNLPDSKTGAKPVFLSDAAVVVLQRQRLFAPNSSYVFPSRHNDERVANLRKAWIRICEHAGLDGLRLHDLRHTAASIAVGRGATLAIVGRLLGHTQAQTTLRYAHVDTNPALHAANEIGRAVCAAMQPKQARQQIIEITSNSMELG